jgi:hypothetical protein
MEESVKPIYATMHGVRVAVLAVLVAVASMRPARADDAADARAHYETAERLYDEGKYEAAIAEFEIAHRKKPHPNVLYNIGQAYERLLDYGASVRAFERYLAAAPPEDTRRRLVENRLRVLRGLPARVSVSSIPDRVRAVVRASDGQIVEQAETPHVFAVPAGDYVLELARTGWQTEHHPLRCEIGQPYFYQYRLEQMMTEATIETEPSGARVFIDERLVGESPWRGKLELGRHALLVEYPGFPWHRETLPVESGAPVRRVIRLERPPRSGRTELVLGAMAYGGVVGPLLVGALSGSTQFTQSGTGVLTLVLSSVAGIGAGFAGAFLSTRNGVPVGTSSILIGGGAFGSGMGAALALGLGVDERSIYGITLLGGAVGIGAATLVAHFGKISAGDAALVNSGGIWATGAAALLAESIPWEGGRPDAGKVGWFVLGGTALGLTAGALSARFLERSRTEVAIVDLSALVGTALGFALGYAVGGNTTGSDALQQGSRFSLGGMALGLVAGGFVARSWGKRVRPPRIGPVALSAPAFHVAPVLTPEGRATQVTFDLLQGRF